MRNRRRLAGLAAAAVIALGASAPAAFAWDGCGCYCPPPPTKKKCNSGRGNGSEGNSAQLITPGTGSAGLYPTVDCDPGNSGAKNRGGD